MRTLMALVVAAFVSSACSTADEPTVTTPLRQPDLVIAMVGYSFLPADVEFPAGNTVTIEVRNDDAIDHDWALLTTTIGGEDELEDDMIAEQLPVKGSAVERITFEVPEAGVYQIVCTIPGHISQGMIGTLTAS